MNNGRVEMGDGITFLGRLYCLLTSWDLWIFASFLTAVSVAVAYDRSAKFRYYLKFSVYVIVCSITALLIIPPSLIKPRHVKNVL